ncbi:MAG: hypothetical protein HY077_04645 [Elusimicrobia bacterium]|nr:hypothetical protein [Elusimicrobiota bacterium]
MNAVMEAEVVEPGQGRPRVRLTHVKALGLFGTALAVLTMFAAFGVGLLVLFGTTLLAATAAWLLWARVFAPEFTQWVFGTPYAPFWKLFVLFLAAGSLMKLFRPLRKR